VPTQLQFGASLPGELAFVAIVNLLASKREGMSPETRDRWDRIEIEMAESLWKGWKKLFE
jgi:hypothetical protein